jgi:hypothetical protein
VSAFRKLAKDRFVSIARGDIAATICQACQGVEARFGTWIVEIGEHASSIAAQWSDGSDEEFDLTGLILRNLLMRLSSIPVLGNI